MQQGHIGRAAQGDKSCSSHPNLSLLLLFLPVQAEIPPSLLWDTQPPVHGDTLMGGSSTALFTFIIKYLASKKKKKPKKFCTSSPPTPNASPVPPAPPQQPWGASPMLQGHPGAMGANAGWCPCVLGHREGAHGRH